jgi:Kdo2-lipid IVA lauroyltransferase/acyltransferase
MTKTTQHKLEYIFVKGLIFLVNILPIRWGIRCGDIIGFVAFSVIRYRRKVSLTNLRNCFGDRYTSRQYKKIALGAYINMGRTLMELAMFPSLTKTDLSKKIKVVNGEPLREYFKSGKGAVMISGHFGSWEMMGAYLAQTGWPIDFLVGIQHNHLVNDLMNKHRAMFGIGLIEIGVAARGVFGAIKNGRGVAMLSDQDAGSDGVVVDFLGRASSTAKGPAAFALKTGTPIFYGAFVREGLDHHTLFIEGPITVEKSADKEDDIKRLTQAYSDQLTKYITKYPDHWLWSHKRWKSTFPDDYR